MYIHYFLAGFLQNMSRSACGPAYIYALILNENLFIYEAAEVLNFVFINLSAMLGLVYAC